MKPNTCNDCPNKEKRCVTTGIWDNKARITFLVSNPSWVSVNSHRGDGGSPFMGRTGILLRSIIKLLRTTYPDIDIHYSACYASGSADTVNKKSITACRYIWGREWIDKYINQLEPHIIVAFGIDAAKAAGLHARKISDIRGIITSTDIGGKQVNIIPTVSTKHIYKSPAIINVAINDILKGFKLVYLDQDIKKLSIEELSTKYVIPKTLNEVKDVCDSIIKYYDPSKVDGPDKWPIAVDIETNTLHPHRKDARINIVSIAWDDGKSTAITLDHPDVWYDPTKAWEYIESVLTSPKPKTFHNGKFDLKFLRRVRGVEVNNYSWDTMLVEHWMNENIQGSYGLKPLTRDYLPAYAGYEEQLYQNLGKEEREEDNGFENIDLDILLPYAAVDADVTRQIHKLQMRKLHRRPGNVEECRFVLDNLYLPASIVLGDMEYDGVRIDVEKVERFKKEADELINKVAEEIYDLTLQEFNINSNKELGKVLTSCGFPVIDLTECGDMAVTKNVFSQYLSKYEHAANESTKDKYGCITDGGRYALTEKLLLYKSAVKMRTSFLEKLSNQIKDDGRVHAGFNLAGTATGRLSSSKPNLQNIPKIMCNIVRRVNGDKVTIHPGFNVKSLFIPDNDKHIFFNADIKAAEIRVLSMYANDKTLINAINDGFDIHTVILTHIKHPHIPVNLSDEKFYAKYKIYADLKDEGDKEINKFRTDVKRTVFGTLYGARAPKIAEQLGDESPEGVAFAQKIINAIFKTFPGVEDYISKVHKDVSTDKRVKTVFNRYRRFWMAQTYKSLLSKAEREAVNFKIQSTASDLVLTALIDIKNHASEIGAHVYLTVHDSIAGSIEKDKVKMLIPFLDKYIIEGTKKRLPELPVPFAYDVEVGKSYGELQPLEQYLGEESL